MSAARFVSFVLFVFMLIALPFVLVQASGVSSAGLSAGFRMPLEQLWLLTICLIVGVCAAWLEDDGYLIAPFSCLMAAMGGASLHVYLTKDGMAISLVMISLVALIACLKLCTSRGCTLAVIISGTVGFHLGRYVMVAMPDVAAPLFYLLGVMLAMALSLAIASAFGLTLRGEAEAGQPHEDTLRDVS